MGNPPYNSQSSNNGKWIMGEIEEYKKVNGEPFRVGKNWLGDDYVKFIRLGQVFVEKNKEGVLAYITNHKFTENVTFRGMRWNLLQAFDKIYIIDLHGGSKENVVCQDGSRDENVFIIQQGVSINIFVKTGRKAKNAPAEVHHFDVYGKRKEKFDFLLTNNLAEIPFERVIPSEPFFFMKPKNEDYKEEYEKGFKIDELMPQNSSGPASANDFLNISFSHEEQLVKIEDLLDMDEIAWRKKYKRPKDSRDWKFNTARQDAALHRDRIYQIAYRPFDMMYTCYTGMSRGLYSSPQQRIMKHLLGRDNLALCATKINRDGLCAVLIVDRIVDKTILSSKDNANIFPLYLYPDQADLLNTTRTPNLDRTIVAKIVETIKVEFEEEKSDRPGKFAPLDLLDYIYGALHSPLYRERFGEFLKDDFPRVPYPEDSERFWDLAKRGGVLRRLHLLDGVEPRSDMAAFPVGGSNEVETLEYIDGRVKINTTQYFDNVSVEIWNFRIGAYQPAQKWLKDRQMRSLTFDDIEHYQKIIRALDETKDVMVEIE